MFLPADSIEPPISRSAYLARGLAKHADVYYVVWEDPRSADWQGKSSSSGNSLACMLRTLLRQHRLDQPDHKTTFYRVSCSMLLDASLHRIVGRTRAAKLMHAYNRRRLQSLVRELRPDIVFHADGFYFFPAVAGDHLTIADMQDDINWGQLDQDFADYFKEFFSTQFRWADRSYIVSDAAKASLNDNLSKPVPFVAVPNGADFPQIRGISTDEIELYRARHRLHGKFVISYIGGPAKFDPDFSARLFAHAEIAMPEAQFLVVGKIRPMPFRNVTWTGPVPPEVAAVYYNLSDVGTVLRDCGSDPFLSNSVPLKFVQYAAARKPVLSSQIDWAMNSDFPNIVCILSSRAEDWRAALQRIQKEFVWTAEMEKSWECYSWHSICGTLFEDLRELAASHVGIIAG